MRSKGEPSLSDAEKQGEDDSTATVQDATKVCMFFLIGSKWVTKMNFTFWGATEGIPRGTSREKNFLLRVCVGGHGLLVHSILRLSFRSTTF